MQPWTEKGKPLGRFELFARVSPEELARVPEGDSFPLLSTNCMTARGEAVSLLCLPCGMDHSTPINWAGKECKIMYMSNACRKEGPAGHDLQIHRIM